MKNMQTVQACRLAEDESYRFMFHPGNLKGLQKPKRKNGDAICLRYHTIGHCFKDCNFASGHGSLDSEEASEMAKFLEGVRESRKKFTSRTKRSYSSRQQDKNGNKNEQMKDDEPKKG